MIGGLVRGGRRAARTRLWTWWARRQLGSFVGPLHVNRRCTFTSGTSLGANVHFNGMVVTGTGRVTIGDNFHSGTGCLVVTDVHNYEGTALPYDHTYRVKDVTIDDNVWLGDRVILLGGAHIGEGAIIQAGSVVVSDIAPCAIAGGHPAAAFASRDVEHYERLKQQRAFH